MRPFFSWRQAVLQSELVATTRHVLLTLGCHMNDAGESCYPSIKMLAKETRLSRQAVMEHLEIARAAGWICVRRHGFSGQVWRRNEYSIAWPEQKAVNQDDHEAVNQGDLSLSVVNSSKSKAIALKIYQDLRKANPRQREPAWATWTRDIDLMLGEGSSADELLELWAIAHAHPFWGKNILSPGALRKQWDRLTILSSKETSSARQPEDSQCSFINRDGQRCSNAGTSRRNGGPWFCFECRDKRPAGSGGGGWSKV